MSQAPRLSKPFYLAALLGIHALGVLPAIADALFGLVPDERVAPLLFPVSIVLQIAFFVVFLFFWYRAWKAVYSPDARFTPAARILKLLIPIYHIYWCFPAFWGWAKRYNEYLRERNLALPPVKAPFFFIFSLLFAASIVSVYIRFVFLFLGFSGGMEMTPAVALSREVIYIVIMGGITWYVCNAVNRLPFAPAESETSGAPPANQIVEST
jgi:hypothetical protein